MTTPDGRPRAFAGYYNRPAPFAPAPNLQVGPGTPGGEYLRRFWHPVMLASELRDLPVVVRILGEDLVIFRDRRGQVGLVRKHCIHRNASLEFGIIGERGIRCSYHGWHYDVDGALLETPAEPPTSKICANFSLGAYRTHEYCGMIFAYMGPPEEEPAFPVYDTFEFPAGTRLVPLKLHYPCNWTQIVENAADPVHTTYLHAVFSKNQFARAFEQPPALEFIETPIGFLASATRKVGDYVFVRAVDIIQPNVAQFTAGSQPANQESYAVSCYMTRWVTPIDDHNCFYMGYVHINDFTTRYRVLKDEMFGVGRMGFMGQTPDRPYEERQRDPGDFDAIVSQGRMSDIANEHLGTSDRGVVMFRRQLGRGIAAMQKDETAPIPKRCAHGLTRSYCHELVIKIPEGSHLDDAKTLGDFGRRVAKLVIDADQLPPAEREEMTYGQIRDLVLEQVA